MTRYRSLINRFNAAVNLARFPRRIFMWRYPKNRLGEGWSLTDLAERVQAADQLGFDVQIKHADDGLSVYYVARFVEPT